MGRSARTPAGLFRFALTAISLLLPGTASAAAIIYAPNPNPLTEFARVTRIEDLDTGIGSPYHAYFDRTPGVDLFLDNTNGAWEALSTIIAYLNSPPPLGAGDGPPYIGEFGDERDRFQIVISGTDALQGERAGFWYADTIAVLTDPALVVSFGIVPEPSTALLVACGLVGMAVRRRRGLSSRSAS